jgi:hypothetical protein
LTLSLTRAKSCRVTGFIVVGLFAASLFLPGHQRTSAGSILGQADDVVPGWRLASLGWLGPLELCFAWFANLPLIVCVVRMLRGKSPNRPVAIATACLALSVLLPQRIWQPADGWHTGHFHGAAIWLWLSCFGVVLLASIKKPEGHELTSQHTNR